MRNLFAGGVTRPSGSLARGALAAVTAGLPMLAQAQFSAIHQSGSATVTVNNTYSYPGCRYTSSDSGSAPLADMPLGSQSVSPQGISGPVSATLTTSVATEQIDLWMGVGASTDFRTIYDANHVPLQNVATDGSASARATIDFAVD